MAVLTFKSDEFRAFPPVLKEYASHMHVIKGNSEKTICEYLMDLRTFFRYRKMMESGNQVYGEDFEKISISDLSIDDIRRVRSTDIIEFIIYAKMERDNGTSARMRKLSALKSFFKYAYHKKNYIDSNPTENVDAPKKGTTLPKYLSVKEAVRLLECVREDVESPTNQRDYSIIALFLNTGMRLSELVGLNLESFDSDLEYIKVLGKGNKERIIYLNSSAKDAVKGYLRVRLDPKYIRTSEHAFFLSARQTRISTKTVQYIVYKYLDRAGLGSRGLSVHKLRHTAATLMYQSGNVDIRVLKDILGHEQLNTTQIYTHLGNRNLQDAMNNNPLSDVKIKNKLR
jgi:site-specific recombinase XerD